MEVSKSGLWLTSFSVIIIPVLTVCLNAVFANWQTRQSVELQEFNNAYTILLNDKAPKELRDWATDRVVRYVADHRDVNFDGVDRRIALSTLMTDADFRKLYCYAPPPKLVEMYKESLEKYGILKENYIASKEGLDKLRRLPQKELFEIAATSQGQIRSLVNTGNAMISAQQKLCELAQTPPPEESLTPPVPAPELVPNSP
ncbi:hypothetical protein [Mesorhizobium sp. WSM4887]|uniref:hypothetical protein n=1 Tax=Mesorhizobium sp. WSM4887 TaxID=3038543 RepID=UPI002417C2B7|nr:hypothetical protein [Mesorhizobium sp. WSM4887]MDG4887705.1 hypothetical protein [Mesorhizobium sp. WSM4887]